VDAEPLAPPTDLVSFAEECGMPLEPFQRRIAKAINGPEREHVILLPRGQGKTSLLALVALHHLLTVPGPRVYVAAAAREQARILFEYARDLARRSPYEDQITFRHLELRAAGGYLRVLASDAPKVHGLTPSLAISDEGHAHADDELYIALRTAMLKRPGARMVNISTAGQGADSPLGRLRARALAQPHVKRTGAFTDARGPGLRMLEWAVPEDGDVDDARQVKQANPASWITEAGLREQRQAVPDLAYRRYHCNQWTAREGHWLPPGAWQSCVGEPAFKDGEPIWIGVDVGGERSASAVVWVNEALHVGAEIYQGEEGVLDCIDCIRELAGRYQVRELVFDPWRFGQAAQEFERAGLTVVAFPQQDARMIPASSRLHAAIVEHRITFPTHDVLARHAADAIARHSRRGWRIDKPNPRINIDGIIALCMAVERAEFKPEPVELLGWL
jgi:phage terminase large subunit-like protein